MRVKLAKTAGFCFGVHKAVEKADRTARRGEGPVYTFGPLIHNPQAVAMLAKRGIKARRDFTGLTAGQVVLRAHGVPPDVRSALEAQGLDVVDATCPNVTRSQRVAADRSQKGCRIILVGDTDHAEVASVRGHCQGPCAVISSVEEAERLELSGPVCVLAQTTFDEQEFHEIAEAIQRKHPETEVVDTLCQATSERQAEVRRLAQEVEALVVVGGKHSANTRRLAEISRRMDTPTYHIETAEELDPEEMSRYESVGLTAGASTPHWITQAVLDTLHGISSRKTGRRARLSSLLRVVLESNLYTALGAAALTLACFLLQHGRRPEAPLLWISFSYIFCIYVWNRLSLPFDPAARAPRRVVFSERHRRLLVALSAGLTVVSVVLAAMADWRAAFVLTGAYGIGLAYSIPLVPTPWRRSRLARLKDIPASKDVFTALGWAVVTVLVPALATRAAATIALGLTALAVFLIAFLRATMYDFTDIHGDRLLGRETLPVLLGRKPAKRLLGGCAVALALIFGLGAALGVFPSLGYWLLLVPAYAVGFLYFYHNWVVASEAICSIVVDGTLLLAGLLAYGWWSVQ